MEYALTVAWVAVFILGFIGMKTFLNRVDPDATKLPNALKRFWARVRR